MPVASPNLETRVALLEFGHAVISDDIKDIKTDLAAMRTEVKASQSRIIGWLVGACFALTSSSVLLVMNLVR